MNVLYFINVRVRVRGGEKKRGESRERYQKSLGSSTYTVHQNIETKVLLFLDISMQTCYILYF